MQLGNDLDAQYHDDTNLTSRISLHQRYSTNVHGWHPWVFDHLDLSPDAEVLELGCGPGDLWSENAVRILSTWQITLSDRSPGMVAVAQRRLTPVVPQARFAVVDASTLPFENARFDAVIANHMLYHVPDLNRTLGEIRRVLRPDGRLYAATNGRNHLNELTRLLKNHAAAAAWDGSPANFSLENGPDYLAHWFDDIVRNDYPDSLHVTEGDALLAYLLSTDARLQLNDEALAGIREEVRREIARNGYVHVTKAAGLFVCGTRYAGSPDCRPACTRSTPA